MEFKPSQRLIQKAQGMLSDGRYVQSIDLNLPDGHEFRFGDPMCRVIYIDTNNGEKGCLYMKRYTTSFYDMHDDEKLNN